MLLTKEAYQQKEEEIEKLNEKLKDVRKEKALQISQSDGDCRHDNFGFEQAEIQERGVIRAINDLHAELRNATIVEENDNSEKKNVQVGNLVKLRLDYGDNDVIEVKYRLQALPSNDGKTVTLNSPIGKAIFRKSVGFKGECKIAEGNRVIIEILEIC